jgi:LAO/AO transport system ATPase
MVVDVGGIIPAEDVQTLLESGVHRIYHTGASAAEIIEGVREVTRPYEPLETGHPIARLSRNISLVHAGTPDRSAPKKRPGRVIGLTGAPGAGKSTLVGAMANETVRKGGRLAVVAFDPMSPITRGALLGDRLRVDFNTVDESVYYRSLAITNEDYATLPAIVELIGGAGFDTLVVETVGAGQNDVAIREHVDTTAVVLVPGMGDSVQMDKAGIIEIADVFIVNKADYPQESRLVRQLKEVSGPRPIFETIATRGRGVPELAAALFGSTVPSG